MTAHATSGASPLFDSALVQNLAELLDSKGSGWPVLQLDTEGGRLTAAYARLAVFVVIEPASPDVHQAGAEPTCFAAPSATAALSFVTAVESVRQGSQTPNVRFQHAPFELTGGPNE